MRLLRRHLPFCLICACCCCSCCHLLLQFTLFSHSVYWLLWLNLWYPYWALFRDDRCQFLLSNEENGRAARQVESDRVGSVVPFTPLRYEARLVASVKPVVTTKLTLV